MSSELEIENERLVTQFCLDWAKRDVNLLADYLADDIVYQMFEGRPDIIGREAFINELGGFLTNLKEVEWEIVRSHTIGNLVINDRIDRNRRLTRFPVTNDQFPLTPSDRRHRVHCLDPGLHRLVNRFPFGNACGNGLHQAGFR